MPKTILSVDNADMPCLFANIVGKMSVASNNRVYKVTSLFIKTAILILSFWFILHELNSASTKFDLASLLALSDIRLLSISFCLMFLNWGIESLKWKILVSPLEKLSFFTAFRSVFAGVTVSIFMPNRIGEFAGRIFFLQKADKIEATLKNFVGSLAQFSITLFAGLFAFIMAGSSGYLDSISVDIFNLWTTRVVLIFIVIVLTTLFILNRNRSKLPVRVQSWFRAIFETGTKDAIIILLLSAFRYCVFLFQYHLVLMAFGVRIDIGAAFNLIAIIFLITSVIPTFAFTEIFTRGAAAVYLFSVFNADKEAVLAASFFVWIINLALPALAGSAFIWKLKFFRAS
jgi:hypothetical protein